jgi:hypothetical protein
MAFVTTKVKDSEDSPFFAAGNASEDFVICKSPDKLQTLLNALHKEKQLHYVSDGDWSLHDLIMQLLKHYKPADLFMTDHGDGSQGIIIGKYGVGLPGQSSHA